MMKNSRKTSGIKFTALLLIALLLLPAVLFSASCGKRDVGVAVLTYHRIATHEIKVSEFPDNKWVNDLDNFRENMKYLRDNGYRTLSTDEFCDWYDGKLRLNEEKCVLITFDDGDAENYYNVLPVLKEYGLKATCFIVGNKIGTTSGYDGIKKSYLDAEMIKEIREEYPDFEIQSHTYGCHFSGRNSNYLIKRVSREQFRADCERMKRDFGTDVLAYPYGVKADFCPEVLAECGYRVAFGFGQSDLPYGRAKRTDARYYISRIKVCANNETADKFSELLKRGN